MNYYQARQREADGRWDFTCRNDGRIWPVGYCAGWRDLPPDLAIYDRPEEKARREAHRAKYHTDGHATAEEAERCHWEYEREIELSEHTYSDDQLHRCRAPGCANYTHKTLELRHAGTMAMLCDEHRTREVFDQLYPFGPGRWRVSSW